MKSAWAALRTDKELLGLPVFGGVVALVAVLPVLVMAALVPDNSDWLYYVVGVIAVFVVSVISTFFAVALAAGAHERMSGGAPTLKSCVAVAWKHKRGVVGWALLSTTVGLLLNLIQDKLKGFGGVIIRIIGDMAWAIASFFAIPILAANDVGPIDALKLSMSTFKSRWSSAVRVQLRLGLYGLGLVAAAIVGAILVAVAWNIAQVLGILVAIIVVLVVAAGGLLLGAVGSYARVALYRYASGMATPGFSTTALEAAIQPKAAGRGR
ncbi:MAG: DUF6159 family protein [Ilumatobacteraceae bacterium]